MSSPEYPIHLQRGRFDDLWEEGAGDFPYEDPEEIDRILAEELPPPRRRKRKKTPKR